MLKTRVIPTLLWKDFGLVKGVAFDSWRRVGSVLPAIKVYNQREVDELILVDIVGHLNEQDPDYESIQDFSRECHVPLTVGGGIKNVEQVQKLLRSGADKISLNTCLYSEPEILEKVASRHGSQCVVGSIDVGIVEGKWICFSNAGKANTGRELIQWAKELESRGAGELLITSIDRDGTMEGYDKAMVKAVVDAVNIPVIASGGAGTYMHMVDVVKEAGAAAVAAASIFHFTELTPAGVKDAFKGANIPVRMPFRIS